MKTNWKVIGSTGASIPPKGNVLEIEKVVTRHVMYGEHWNSGVGKTSSGNGLRLAQAKPLNDPSQKLWMACYARIESKNTKAVLSHRRRNKNMETPCQGVSVPFSVLPALRG